MCGWRWRAQLAADDRHMDGEEAGDGAGEGKRDNMWWEVDKPLAEESEKGM